MKKGAGHNAHSTKKLLLLFAVAVVSYAATPAWLDLVAPVITPAEKKAWLALSEAERPKYEEEFWSHKAISAKDYSERVAYIDAKFGSSRPGSGVNTDQGRVYLALGPPNKITQIPSSRIFQPVEIWYYSVIPGVINTEVSLMFFQKNGVGFPKLYSPTLDTIRALLNPQSSNVHAFGPNDGLNEQDIRNVLKVPPSEDEVVSAAVNVASGVRYEGNDEILGKVSSPGYMLGLKMRTGVNSMVTSRLITSHPKLETVESVSVFGGSQIDLKLETSAQREIDVEVFEDDVTVYRNQLRLRFGDPQAVLYTHRLDLLPGSYRVIVTVDSHASPYGLEVHEPRIGEIQRANLGSDVSGRVTPFEFDGRQLELNPDGRYAVVPLPHPGKVTWMIRRGGQMLWRGYSDGQQIASIELPAGKIEPGSYKIEALLGDSSTSADVVIGKNESKASTATVVSFNANLSDGRRYAFVGHQWLLRGKFSEARRSLQASIAKGVTVEAQIELSRADALEGSLDAARDRVKSVLAFQPDSFEALSVYAYIETRFQDYAVAAQLYRRALAIQESPAIRAALSKLPAE